VGGKGVGGQKGEMTQALYAHMNNKTIQKKDPYLENLITKNWADGVSQSVRPEFKPQYRKKRKKE
jgi:hypothetical protein